MKNNFIYVGAGWCPKCKVYQPKFIDYCTKNNLSYKIIDADEDESAEMITKYNIKNIPVVVTLTEGSDDYKISNIEDFINNK